MKWMMYLGIVFSLMIVGCSSNEEKAESKQPEKVTQKSTQPQVETTKEVEKSNDFDANKAYLQCTSCHGADGSKKALGKSEIIKGQSKEQILASLKAYKAGTQDKRGMGALMKSQVSKFSDSELEALAAFVAKL